MQQGITVKFDKNLLSYHTSESFAEVWGFQMEQVVRAMKRHFIEQDIVLQLEKEDGFEELSCVMSVDSAQRSKGESINDPT